MLNRVCIMGRLTKKPEIRTAPGGAVVASFCVAITRNYISKASEERGADFIDVTAWRGLAEFASTHFDKGDPIVVEGELRSKLWTKDGVTRKSVSIVADNIFFGAPKKADGPVSSFAPDDDTGEGAVEEPEGNGVRIPEDPDF